MGGDDNLFKRDLGARCLPRKEPVPGVCTKLVPWHIQLTPRALLQAVRSAARFYFCGIHSFPYHRNSLIYTPYSLLAAFVLTGEQGVCVDAEVFVVLKHDAVHMSAPTAAR